MTIKELRKNYKVWALIIRAVVFALPAFIIWLGTWAKKLGSWLDRNVLPNPRKRLDI